jgi:toxin FitB
MNSLIDTNVLSELVRPKPDAKVLVWAKAQTHFQLSVVTVEEVYYGLAWKPNERVKRWFENFLETYTDVLPITPEIAKRAGELWGDIQKQGDSRSQADMLIAATALTQKLVLVTRNEKDFEGCEVKVLNPW